MPPFKDLTGQTFGRLTAVAPCCQIGQKRGISWVCNCKCGNQKVVVSYELISGKTQSCRCLQREVFRAITSTHGMSSSSTYKIWRDMNDRCSNEKRQDYSRYGGRGIEVCERWQNSFESFLEDMGERPEGLTLDRIDVNGNYEPSNCRWATQKEQQRNKRNSRFLTYKGETLTLAEWSERTGIGVGTLWRRLELGWSVEAALTVAIRGGLAS